LVEYVASVCSSQAVLEEIAEGDPDQAASRLEAMRDIRLLAGVLEIDELAKLYVKELQIPARASADAVHLAYAVQYRVDYLLTWNCTHLANPSLQLKLHRYNLEHGLWLPMSATPEQLLYSS
jgi:predicted nucleic acid-binding protein